jgi:hypothetical protein
LRSTYHCRFLAQPPGHLELLPIAFATLREFRGRPPPPLSMICQAIREKGRRKKAELRSQKRNPVRLLAVFQIS